jgi:hypothetical protein
MKNILLYLLIALVIFFYFERRSATSNSEPRIVVSSESDDPCSTFKDQRTCDLMSMHDSVKRACMWAQVTYVHNVTKAEIETEACISAP